MPAPNRRCDRTNAEEPSTERACTEHDVPRLASDSAQRRTDLARIDDASRELLASVAMDGFVPRAQLVHHGPLGKKNKNYKMGENVKVTIRSANESAQSETYHGVCIGSGQWKEVFLLQGAEGTFHNQVLKVTKLVWPRCERKLDVEPKAFQKLAHTKTTLKVLTEFIAVDQHHELYHCWITEQVIPLGKLLDSNVFDGECLAVDLTFLVASLAHEQQFYTTDCKADNFGIRRDRTLDSTLRSHHEVVLIDGGHSDLSPQEPHCRSRFNRCLKNLWAVTFHFAPKVTEVMRKKLSHEVTVQDILNELKAMREQQASILKDERTLEKIFYEAFGGPKRAGASEAQSHRSVEKTLPATGRSAKAVQSAAEQEATLLIHAANLGVLTPELVKSRKLPNGEDVKAALKRTFAEMADEKRIDNAIAAAWELGYASGKRFAISDAPDID